MKETIMKNKTSTAALLVAAISASAALAFIPGFFAWREEHRARLQAEETLAQIVTFENEREAKKAKLAHDKVCAELPAGTYFDVKVQSIEGRLINILQTGPIQRSDHGEVSCDVPNTPIMQALVGVNHSETGQSKVCLAELRRAHEDIMGRGSEPDTIQCMAIMESESQGGISIGGNATIRLNTRTITLERVP